MRLLVVQPVVQILEFRVEPPEVKDWIYFRETAAH